jgi:hypothetical protein
MLIIVNMTTTINNFINLRKYFSIECWLFIYFGLILVKFRGIQKDISLNITVRSPGTRAEEQWNNIN